MKRFLLYVFFTALVITGCSATSPETLKPTLESSKPNLPALDGNWRIKMIHSGGIMGLLRSIELSSDGNYTVMDERANKTVTSELTTDELSKLKEQVASSEYIPASNPDGRNCNDCFVYDLEIQGNGEKFSIQLNDVNLSNSGLESLIVYLRGLIEAALK